MSSGFNIQKNNVDLKSINEYLQSKGVNLTEQENAQLNSIFDESDTYDDKNQQEGKDGYLKGNELNAFWYKISTALPSIKNHIVNFIKQDVETDIKESLTHKPDALRFSIKADESSLVNSKNISDIIEIININDSAEIEAHKLKKKICQKMYNKWTGDNAFKSSPLKPEFFEKLYDVMEQLNITKPNDPAEKERSAYVAYESEKEKIFDQFIAIFAGEAQLDPKTIGYVKSSPRFYGLFQLSKEGLDAAKKWAAKHPEVCGMNNIEQSMTLGTFRNLKGENQLDYLVAYIGASRDSSNMDPNEEFTPAKIWSMIKLPNLPEDNPQKLARRELVIEQKTNAIDSIVARYSK